MDAARVGRLMGRLGWCFVVGMFFSISVDGRSLLFAPAALLAAITLVSLADAAGSDPPRRWLGHAAVAAGAAAALGAVVFVPGVDDGGPGLLALLAAAVSSALYAHGMGRWCNAAGWRTIARVWARATRAAAAGALACLVLIAVVLQAPTATDLTSTDVDPDIAFGRAIGESGATWWALGGVLVLAVSVALRVATGHRSMRAAFELHDTPTASTAAVTTF